MKLKKVAIDLVNEPGRDIRSWISREGLEELAESIKRRGVLQPLRVFEKDGRFEIQDGHRRYLAAKMAGLQSLPVLVVHPKVEDVEIDKLMANLSREDLSPLDIARQLAHLRDNYRFDAESLASIIGKSVSRVHQLLGLLKADKPILEALEDKRIGEHIARGLMQIPDPEKREYYLSYAVDGGANIRTVQSWVAQEKASLAPPPEIQENQGGPPRAAEYQPLMFECPCCGCRYDANAAIAVRVCGECHVFLRDLFKRMREEAKEGQ